MNFLVTTIIAFLLCAGKNAFPQSGNQYLQSLSMNKEIRICGPILTNTLELVCQGRFNTMNKRSIEDNGTPSREWTDNDRTRYALFPFRVKRNALALNGRNTYRRRPRNVADECCYLKACTLAEMTHYCEGK